jgi:hypothetical protein
MTGGESLLALKRENLRLSDLERYNKQLAQFETQLRNQHSQRQLDSLHTIYEREELGRARIDLSLQQQRAARGSDDQHSFQQSATSECRSRSRDHQIHTDELPLRELPDQVSPTSTDQDRGNTPLLDRSWEEDTPLKGGDSGTGDHEYPERP